MAEDEQNRDLASDATQQVINTPGGFFVEVKFHETDRCVRRVGPFKTLKRAKDEELFLLAGTARDLQRACSDFYTCVRLDKTDAGEHKAI